TTPRRSIPVLAAYVTCTCLAALACAYAVYLNLTHASVITDTAQRLDIPVSLTVPFAILLGSAAAGLLAGLAAPGLGTAAAAGTGRLPHVAPGRHPPTAT